MHYVMHRIMRYKIVIVMLRTGDVGSPLDLVMFGASIQTSVNLCDLLEYNVWSSVKFESKYTNVL